MSAFIFTVVLGIIVLYLGFSKNKSILSPISAGGLVVSLILSLKDWDTSRSIFMI